MRRRVLVLLAVLPLVACDDKRPVILIADAGNYRIIQTDDMSGAGRLEFAYPAVNKTLIAPSSIAVDSRGRIYASNFGDDNVSRMDDITGRGFVVYGRRGPGVGEFNGPSGIAIDGQDRLYVADASNSRVVRMDDIDGRGWTVLGRLGSGINEFREPQDLAMDAQQRLYVADRQNGRIVRVDDMSGSGWTTYGRKQSGIRPGTFDLLSGIAVASDGRIYVTDANENVVISIDDMAGTNWTNFGATSEGPLFNQPSGIFVDGASPIYVANEDKAQVNRFQDMDGVGYRIYRGSGNAGDLRLPYDVVVARIPK